MACAAVSDEDGLRGARPGPPNEDVLVAGEVALEVRQVVRGNCKNRRWPRPHQHQQQQGRSTAGKRRHRSRWAGSRAARVETHQTADGPFALQFQLLQKVISRGTAEVG